MVIITKLSNCNPRKDSLWHFKPVEMKNIFMVEHNLYPRKCDWHLALDDEASPPPNATTDPTASKGLSMGGSRSALPVVLSRERMRSRMEGRREGRGDGSGAADDATWWRLRESVLSSSLVKPYPRNILSR